MLVSKTFRYRLKINKTQEKFFYQTSGNCRFLYNHFLNERITKYKEENKSLSYYDQANLLPFLKKELEWLRLSPSQSLQHTLKDLDQAFKNFFRRCKQGGESPGFPQFKRKGVNDSFRLPQGFQIIEKGKVKLPKIGIVKYVESRPIEDRIRNITIRRDYKHWYVSFNCEVEQSVQQTTKISQIGIDRGVVNNLTLSNGDKYNMPKDELQKLQKKIKYLQTKLSKQKLKSNNRNKTKERISKLYLKIRNIRQDWNHKYSTMIAKSHSLIVLENLNTKSMTKSAKGDSDNPGKNVKIKSMLNRDVLNCAWYQFESFLTYKCDWYGSYLTTVDPKHTSQECSQCGNISKENRKSQSIFSCKSCGYSDNADINAANNILTRGHRGLASGATALAG